MRIARSRQEVAEYCVAELDVWLSNPAQSRTVYLTDAADIGTYTEIRPDDHLADLLTISYWDFGPRQTSQPDAPLTHDEIESLTRLFFKEKSVEIALNPVSGVREELFYPEDMAKV